MWKKKSCIKGSTESLPRVDSAVSLMHQESSDLGSLILIKTIPKERILSNSLRYRTLVTFHVVKDKEVMTGPDIIR